MLNYRNAEANGDTVQMNAILEPSVKVDFTGSTDTFSRRDIVLNSVFNLPLNPSYEIVRIDEIDDSTVLLEILETDDLKEVLGIDSVRYKYTYKLKDSRIHSIVVDTLPNMDYNYQQLETEYAEKMDELMDYISLNYPKEYQEIENLDKEASQIMIIRAREKYGR